MREWARMESALRITYRGGWCGWSGMSNMGRDRKCDQWYRLQVTWSLEATVGLCFLLWVTVESIGRFWTERWLDQTFLLADHSGSFVQIDWRGTRGEMVQILDRFWRWSWWDLLKIRVGFEGVEDNWGFGFQHPRWWSWHLLSGEDCGKGMLWEQCQKLAFHLVWDADN